MGNTVFECFTFQPYHATLVDNRILVIAVFSLSKIVLAFIAISIHGIGIKVSDFVLQAAIVFSYIGYLLL